MNKNNFAKSKIFLLTLFLTIGIVILIPISTTWVFNDVFSLNYTRTSNLELKAIEGVNDEQLVNVSSVDIIPIPQQENLTQQVINENILEETTETLTEEPEEILVEEPEEILVEEPEEILVEEPEEILVEKPEEIITGPYSINLVRSGFVIADPLNDGEINDDWTFGGSAVDIQAPHDHFADTDGMHIGIQAPERGVYAGHNIVVPPTNGTLFHATITTPRSYIPNGFLQNGFYVQSSEAPFNFVSCVVNTTTTGKLLWAITYSYFDDNGDFQYQVLWSDFGRPNPNLTRECTIVTNGNNSIRVFLDRIEVYSNHRLDLQMTAPFRAFFELQSSYADEILYNTYTDFYVTSNATIQVLNVPGYIVEMTLTDTSNNLLATGHLINGTGYIDVANFHFPFTANIHAVQNQRQLISTPNPVTIFGGDVYSVDQVQ